MYFADQTQTNIKRRVAHYDPPTAEWRTATEEQRQDWNFRVDHGDVGFFYNQTVNVWLNLASTPVAPVPRGLITYCVD
jgi:hypothetical protein